MEHLFQFPAASSRDTAVQGWLDACPGELGVVARRWFEVMRDCGKDVRELLHDGHPTACVGDTAFAYVDAFTAHVNVGFYRGADLADPLGMLEGAGRYMRHVKLRPGAAVNDAALRALISAAHADIRRRIDSQ